MAELNFGLLTPPGSQSIGNAFVRGQDQAQASQMQNLQMQQATRKGQMDELTYKKALDTEARLNKYYAGIAANGGPKTAIEAETAMINSGISHIADMGAKSQLLRLQNESDLALFTAARTGPTAAPAVVPEPGSFGADVAERRAADPFAPAPDTRTNMMDGAAPATATVNNLPAVTTGASGRTVADMTAERDRMELVPGKRAAARVKTLTADIALASKPPVYHNVPGVGLVNPVDKSVVVPSVEPKANSIKELEAFMKMTPQAQATFMAMRRAGASNLTVNNEKAYGGAIAAGAAKQDLAQIDRAQSLPQEFAKIDETLGILRNTDINTGLGADLFTILDKARVQVTADKKAGKRAVNTEYLDSLLGSAVFPQIQALGIGARGLDTPAERDFLRKVLTGSVSLSKDTLIKMTELRRKGLENEATLFNKRVKKGAFKPFEEAARRSVEAVTVPPLPTGAISVTAPNGKTYPFDTPAQAAAFKKAAGIP
jgi:hypothetical protein